LADVLSRRTRALLLGRDAAAEAAEDVARLIASELDWTDEDVAREVQDFRAIVRKELESAALPVTSLPARQASA
ncbi:MAG: glycerol-3-phosphate dehydrogenase C-terminal domain-containing protein, partial [Acidimicrobiia bacterium]